MKSIQYKKLIKVIGNKRIWLTPTMFIQTSKDEPKESLTREQMINKLKERPC